MAGPRTSHRGRRLSGISGRGPGPFEETNTAGGRAEGGFGGGGISRQCLVHREEQLIQSTPIRGRCQSFQCPASAPFNQRDFAGSCFGNCHFSDLWTAKECAFGKLAFLFVSSWEWGPRLCHYPDGELGAQMAHVWPSIWAWPGSTRCAGS